MDFTQANTLRHKSGSVWEKPQERQSWSGQWVHTVTTAFQAVTGSV